MNKNILFEKIQKSLKSNFSFSKNDYSKREELEQKYINNLDYYFTINLIKKIIFNDCTKNSTFK
jgi:hypothetical protein